jgi:LacI family transcriptional regulator
MSITLAAFRLRIRIPEQLAVISVGDEEPWCALSTPPLSSFAFPGFAIGQRAAQTLRALMDGDSPPTQPVAAGRIVERQSTARASTSNPEIASAIRIIRQHRGVGITIADVANSVGISRSTLERGVCEAIGISPVKEMIRLRLGAAKEMLSTTDAPAKVVAQRCGFADAKYFSTAFRAATGMTPTQYRNQQRGYLLADPAAAPSKDH